MIQKLRNNQLVKAMSVFLIQVILFDLILLPNPTYGQAGPNQTETSGFTLGSTSSLVDDFTGDFSYSIPLMDVDGYPITISYNSNVNMFQEASWVGLGWDLNVGSVSRDMRGIPDDFNGIDEITRKIGMKDYETEGSKSGVKTSIGVGSGVGASLSMAAVYGTYMNSYNGKGTTWDFGMNSAVNLGDYLSFNWGVGFSMDSQNGTGRNNSIGVGVGYLKNGFQFGGNFTASSQFSSREGMKSTHFGLSYSASLKDKSVTQKSHTQDFRGGNVSFSHGSTYSLGTLTSVPRFDFPRYGENTTKSVTVTGIIVLTAVQMSAGNIFSDYYFNDLATDNKQEIKSSAYGYYHMGKGQQAPSSKRAIMDFNRERDSEFSEEMVKIPFSAPTYDFFNVSAMGITGSVRGQRHDVGTLQDPVVAVHNKGSNKAFDTQGGYAFPTGLIIGFAYGQGDVTAEGTSGGWITFAHALFRWSTQQVNGFEEGIFFKAVGEPTPRDMSQWNNFGGNNVLRLDLTTIGSSIMSGSTISASNSTSLNIGTLMGGNSATPIRATYYNPTTAYIYSQKPLKDKIYYQNENEWINPEIYPYNRIDNMRKAHHISAMEVTSINGINYQFDVPVYNKEQSDVVFHAAGLKANDLDLYANSGLVTYSGNDNTWNNAKGRSGFYEKTTIPGYAHSYLLSLMTSSDYIDRTGNGPSIDDFGDYYKFNYARIYNENNPYKWRFPYEANTAKLIQGHLSTPFDDVATYTYGEKEIWYAKSIETKNYIVEFHLNDNTADKRKDGHGVSGENGGINTNQTLRKLDKIVLYNRNDRIENGANAVPLKTVTFVYDYSLCKGNPSTHSPGNFAQSGKLTLKAIHFSGGDSEEATLAPYEFEYDRGAGFPFDNPNFSYIDVDRWGGFKKNSSTYNNIDYPYAEQNEMLANAYANAWKLREIRTPSNGGIQVEYEADRFAYTQNKNVMKMIRVKGLASTIEHTINELNPSGSMLYSNYLRNPSVESLPNEYVYFELDEPITGSSNEQKSAIIQRYLFGSGSYLQKIFFQFRIKVHPSYNTSYENILGFASLENLECGVVGQGSNQVGFVKLITVGVKDNENEDYKVNPIQKSAWQYARLNIPDVVYGNCAFDFSNPEPSNCDYSNDIDAAVAFGKDLNKQLNKKNYCKEFDPQHSFIRLHDPKGFKFGGNARVKSITYTDNWGEMANGEATSAYKWEYHYENKQTGAVTGVAAYEPSLGNVVNPFYEWTVYSNKIEQFPDEARFTVEPVGELLFPAPVVGYSEVSVKFSEIENLTQNAVGEQKTKFFTAKDKPTKVSYIGIQNDARVKENNIFTSKETKLFGLSQGYNIITNDYHGKVKESEIFDAHSSLVQRSVYTYDQDNVVQTLDRDGTLRNETIATEYDIYADSRFVKTEANTSTIGGGVQITWYFPLPILPLPIIMYSNGKTRTGFFVHTINKHINQSAVLEKVETTYLGSTNMAENLVRDRYSGEVIVSSLKDEFNDKLYSVSYPAHWYYPNLQNKYINEHFSLTNANINSGVLSFGASNQPDLVPGDILEISDGTPILGWALTGGNGGAIIQEDGTTFNTFSQNYNIKLKESGRKNRITETMMQVTTKTNPINGSSFVFPAADILSVSAVEYDFNYNVSCYEPHDRDHITEPTAHQVIPNTIINPFKYGLMGNPRITKQMAIQTERETVTDGIRKDSEILDYYPLYALDNGKWYKIDQAGHPDNVSLGDYRSWRELQRIATFDGYARAMEAKDPLDIHAGVLYGFNAQGKLLPVAQAVNARTNQLAFEGFEDNNYLNAETVAISAHDHLNFFEQNPQGVQLTSSHRHTGLHSLEINPEKSAAVKRLIAENSCASGNRISTGEYIVADCDCIKEFSPYPGEYLLSAWVKEETLKPTYANTKIKIEILNSADVSLQTVILNPTGPVLDGWQRIEGKFEVLDNSNAIKIQLSLINESTIEKTYVDDFRIHPFNSEMTTTVYNPNNLLPMATHDGNNFTTFYNYDENNQLVRIRVETVEGIKTISETSTGIRKRYTSN